MWSTSVKKLRSLSRFVPRNPLSPDSLCTYVLHGISASVSVSVSVSGVEAIEMYEYVLCNLWSAKTISGDGRLTDWS